MLRYPDNNVDVLSESEESWRLALERYGRQWGEIERWLQQNPEPPRVFRRLFCVSQAASARLSSCS